MIFAIGIVLAFIGWVIAPRDPGSAFDAALGRYTPRHKISGLLSVTGYAMGVISIAIMAWGNLP